MPRRATPFILLLIAASALALVLAGCPGASPGTGATPTPEPTATPEATPGSTPVTIVDALTHYEITLDFSSGLSHKAMGSSLGTAILNVASLSTYPLILDSYIFDAVNLMAGGNEIIRNAYYSQAINRISDIIIPQDYRDEIDGLASVLCDAGTNGLGDGELSKDELYLLQLILDVGKTSQCSAVSVFGSRSATGHTITGRVLDWYSGEGEQLPKIQAVTTIKNGSKSIVMIGYIGLMSGLTMINDDKLFAAILESSTPGTTATTEDKRSYSMDLRYAMENRSTLEDVAAFLSSDSNSYVAGHLIFLSDPDKSQVLENNLANNRALRTSTSELNDDVLQWGISDAIGCVNSFVLDGNYDNHTGSASNENRWASIISQLTLRVDDVTNDGITAIVSYYTGTEPRDLTDGDLYNTSTQQIVVIEPGTLAVKVFFRPKDGILPTSPLIFETIPISF